MATATKSRKKTEKRDLYQEITDSLVAILEEGIDLNNDEHTWVKPWENLGASLAPRNAVSGRFYRGINILILGLDPRTGDDPRWLTYKQAQSKGWQVRKGEKGTQVYLFKPHTFERENEDGEVESKSVPIIRAFTVFHVSQVDGDIPAFEKPVQPYLDTWETHETAEAIIANAGATINHGGDRAYYTPATDTIQVPERGQFADAYGYYGTVFHELAHWTGGKKYRVERRSDVGGGGFGSESYAKEEVRAEIAAAIVASVSGIPAQPDNQFQHVGYLRSWLKVLKNDKYEVRRAASDAQKIADYLLPSDLVPAEEG